MRRIVEVEQVSWSVGRDINARIYNHDYRPLPRSTGHRDPSNPDMDLLGRIGHPSFTYILLGASVRARTNAAQCHRRATPSSSHDYIFCMANAGALLLPTNLTYI